MKVAQTIKKNLKFAVCDAIKRFKNKFNIKEYTINVRTKN